MVGVNGLVGSAQKFQFRVLIHFIAPGKPMQNGFC
jgi:hypothetical protein